MLDNNILKHINKLQQKKYRKEYEEFLIEGVKGVEEILRSDFNVSSVVIEGDRRESFKDIIDLCDRKGVDIEYCGRKDIDKIKDTETFPGVMAIADQEDYSLDDVLGSSIICLDGVKDPGNLGTIIRTADWFGISSLVLSEDCVDVYNPKVVRSSMGSLFRVKIFQSNDLSNTINNLKDKHKYTIVGLCMEGDLIKKIDGAKKTVYVFGSESHGIREEVEKILNKKYTIAGKGQAESLNVAISVGIVLNNIS